MEIKAIEQISRQEAEEHRRQMSELMEQIEDSKRKAEAAREAQIRESQRPKSRSPLKEVEHDLHQHSRRNMAHPGHHPSNLSTANSNNHGNRYQGNAVTMDRVAKFEDVFMKLQAATGIADIDELVNKFIKNEDQNFSLFNYVNTQTNDIEKLEGDIEVPMTTDLRLDLIGNVYILWSTQNGKISIDFCIA
jgi:hypothetical protein